jgi:hypothetical protein
MSAAALLLVLMGDGTAELGSAIRYGDGLVRPGVYAYVEGGRVTDRRNCWGAGVIATATFCDPSVERLAVTLGGGGSMHNKAVPEGGSDRNFVALIRAEYRLTDRWSVVAEGRHMSTGGALIDRSTANPSDNRILAGIGWGF